MKKLAVQVRGYSDSDCAGPANATAVTWKLTVAR